MTATDAATDAAAINLDDYAVDASEHIGPFRVDHLHGGHSLVYYDDDDRHVLRADLAAALLAAHRGDLDEAYDALIVQSIVHHLDAPF